MAKTTRKPVTARKPASAKPKKAAVRKLKGKLKSKLVKLAGTRKKRAVRAHPKKSRPSAKAGRSGKNPWLQSGWALGVIGAPVLVAVALWRAHLPPPTPAAVELHAEVANQAPPRTPASAPDPVTIKLPPPTAADPAVGKAPAVPVPVAVAPAAPAAPAVAKDVVTVSKAESVAANDSALTGPFANDFLQTKGFQVGERVAHWSELLASSDDPRRKLSHLKDSPKIEDSVPLVPPSFDCTTFVETVSALARSHRPEDFFKNLIAIRYKDGRPTYMTRNHFPEADWIPNNARAGILKDITTSIAGDAGVTAKNESKEIRRSDWLAKQLLSGTVSRKLASLEDDTWGIPIDVKVSYLPVEDADRFIGKIPNGSILNLVRKNKDNKPVLITHQGFVVRQGSQVMLRHVSPSGKIRTVALAEYLRLLKEQNAETWPLLGVNIDQLNDSS